MESHWFNVADGHLNEEEIHRLHMKIKEQRRLIVQKHVGAIDMPHNQKLMDRATESAKSYIVNFYASED